MTARSNPLHRLESFGQSVWLDFIERGFVRSGGLRGLIRDDGLSGVTSNPAIFHQAITEHDVYRPAIEDMARKGLAAHEIHEALVIEDIREAADELLAVFERTEALDGYVSLEVSPHLAHDTEGTYWEAKRLWALVNRPNLMVKVPGTEEGVPAIRRLVADGLNVNVTLLFTVERYAAAAEAFAQGMTDRAARNLPLDRIASVASSSIRSSIGRARAKLVRCGDSMQSRARVLHIVTTAHRWKQFNGAACKLEAPARSDCCGLVREQRTRPTAM